MHLYDAEFSTWASCMVRVSAILGPRGIRIYMYKCKKDTCIAIRGVVTKGGWVGKDRVRLARYARKDMK